MSCARMPVMSHDEETLVLNGTFGSTKRSGPWRVPPRITLRRRFGSVELDFTSADFVGKTPSWTST